MEKYLLGEGRLASRASRDEAFWRSQVNFRPPNPATDEKAYGVKGSVYAITLPAFKRCLDDHLEAHHDLQARLARPGNATRLGVRGSIAPTAPQASSSSSSFFKAGEGIFFMQRKKTEQI
ncbi:hypothetical protein L195_g037156 [Trifolium pratense]|uniref:Uncharacterized protein n=1 Tax=Trifolium pratense TaxID=57577 RepID=A0A2K3LRG9_TRIPR|nr:hypothetical protein L195_g037156 [Trifolium pratense]